MELIHKSVKLNKDDVVMLKNNISGKICYVRLMYIRKHKDYYSFFGDVLEGRGHLIYKVKFRYRKNFVAYKLSPEEAGLYML